MTCRHFRYQVPRECADELREADPEPCPVCDVLPHRRAKMARLIALARLPSVSSQPAAKSGWRSRWFGDRQEAALPGDALPVPTHVPA